MKAIPHKLSRVTGASLLQEGAKPVPSDNILPVGGDGLPYLYFLARCHDAGRGHPSLILLGNWEALWD